MTIHVPILLDPIVEALIEPLRKLPEGSEPRWIVDCTLGGGGHSAELLNAISSDPVLARHKVLAIDQDEGAVARARERFAREIEEGRIVVEHLRISQLRPALEGRRVMGLLADLGFSSDQLEDPERGISFLSEGPLDMRLDRSRGVSCGEFLQQISERELADVIFEYGEERFARRIAKAIVQARRERRLPSTTSELADLIVKSVPPPARHGRVHAATRTFQALRIAVNQELEELDCLLKDVILSLEIGGRVAILSFHSLEDRRVKLAFKDSSLPFKALTKKPLEADDEEVRRNPRSRSAKLRIAERIR